MLRVGLVGLGVMGRNHARVLMALPGVELVVVVEPNAPEGISGVRRVASLDELISTDVDYAVVATPSWTHLEVGLALAEAGIPALIEKPLAVSAEEGRILQLAFSEAGLVGAVGHVERYNAAYQEAKRRIERGDLGRVFQVATRRQSHFPSRISDVGVTLDLATHDIDITTWLCSDRYDWVAARTLHKSPKGTEDLVVASATLTRGTVVNHVINWLSPFKERKATITGERGTFVIDSLTSDLTFFDNRTVSAEWETLATFRGPVEGDVTRFSFPKPEPLYVEHEAFRDAVLGRGAQTVTMTDAVETLQVAERILASAANDHSSG